MDTRADASTARRLRVVAALITVGAALSSCATLGFGVKRNYRTDGLAVLEVRVMGPPACAGCSRLGSNLTRPVEGATVTIRGPRGATAVDTLSMISDVHGQALFEGVPAGSYVLEIKPPSGYQMAAQRVTDLPANAKRTVKYRIDGLFAAGSKPVIDLKR